MSEILTSMLVGLFTGIVTSLTAWWILFHSIVPNIRFSPNICKTPTRHQRSGYQYRIKLENAGRRPVIDVELVAKLRTKGIVDPTVWEVINIPLSSTAISYSNPRILPVRRGARREIVRLYVGKADEFRRPIYPEPVREKAEEGSLMLEDVLCLGSEANLEILAFGYDEFSGARKVFASKPYTIGDIKEGDFELGGLGVEELAPQEQINTRPNPDSGA